MEYSLVQFISISNTLLKVPCTFLFNRKHVNYNLYFIQTPTIKGIQRSLIARLIKMFHEISAQINDISQ